MEPQVNLEIFRLAVELAAPVVGFAVIYYIRSVDKKLDAQDARHEGIAKRLDVIDSFMRSELRTLDVRLSIIEAQVATMRK